MKKTEYKNNINELFNAIKPIDSKEFIDSEIQNFSIRKGMFKVERLDFNVYRPRSITYLKQEIESIKPLWGGHPFLYKKKKQASILPHLSHIPDGSLYPVFGTKMKECKKIKKVAGLRFQRELQEKMGFFHGNIIEKWVQINHIVDDCIDSIILFPFIGKSDDRNRINSVELFYPTLPDCFKKWKNNFQLDENKFKKTLLNTKIFIPETSLKICSKLVSIKIVNHKEIFSIDEQFLEAEKTDKPDIFVSAVRYNSRTKSKEYQNFSRNVGNQYKEELYAFWVPYYFPLGIVMFKRARYLKYNSSPVFDTHISDLFTADRYKPKNVNLVPPSKYPCSNCEKGCYK